MKVDVDNKERIKVFILFLLQSYKVIMGSMLLIFVPRKCGDGVCTVQQNLVTDDMFNKAALGFNYASIGFFLLTYVIELRRENFCVHNFDIDHDVGDNNLAIILKDKPKLLDSLHYHNRLYNNITKATFIVYFINFIMSNIVLYNDETFFFSLRLFTIIPALDKISSYVKIGQENLIAIAIASEVLASISCSFPFLSFIL